MIDILVAAYLLTLIPITKWSIEDVQKDPKAWVEITSATGVIGAATVGTLMIMLWPFVLLLYMVFGPQDDDRVI